MNECFASKVLVDFNQEWDIPAGQILIVNYLSTQSYVKQIKIKRGIHNFKKGQIIYLPFKYRKLNVVWDIKNNE